MYLCLDTQILQLLVLHFYISMTTTQAVLDLYHKFFALTRENKNPGELGTHFSNSL